MCYREKCEQIRSYKTLNSLTVSLWFFVSRAPTFIFVCFVITLCFGKSVWSALNCFWLFGFLLQHAKEFLITWTKTSKPIPQTNFDCYIHLALLDLVELLWFFFFSFVKINPLFQALNEIRHWVWHLVKESTHTLLQKQSIRNDI